MSTPYAAAGRIQQLELAEELAGVGHWSHDFATGANHWSSEVFRIHGLQQAVPPTYAEILALYLPSDAARLDTLFNRSGAKSQGYDFEGRFRRPDGEVRTIRTKARVMHDASGQATTLFGVVRDITDEIRANRLTQVLLARLPIMAAHYTADLTCTFAHGRFLEWLGKTPEQMVGLHAREIMGEALFAQNEPYIASALQGHAQTFERSLVKPSGEMGHTLAQYVPDLDDEGRAIGFFIMVNDTTPLSEARNQAEAAAKAKAEFLSNMSHELRTPLTSIIGFGELLANGAPLDPVSTSYVGRIRDASRSLLATINDILDFSKIEAGQVEIELLPFDPAGLGRGLIELFQPQTEAKGLARDFQGESLPERLLGDETRLRQILMNLTGNAVKFTARGGVCIKASYDGDRKRLRYEVRDSGVGIPPDKRSRLFKRFSQVDASTSRTFGGTGLGLAICQGLIDAMGGEIGVDSVLSEGSCFWFEVPCGLAEPLAVAEPEEDVDHLVVLDGLRVLVVDDNPSNRELVRMVCKPFGVKLVEAAGGAQAVTEANARIFDVILMDIRMPEVDGPMAASIIRTHSGPNRTTPIVAFTADFSSEFPETWNGLFDGRLSKPIVTADLIMTLAAFGEDGHDGRSQGPTHDQTTASA